MDRTLESVECEQLHNVSARKLLFFVNHLPEL